MRARASRTSGVSGSPSSSVQSSSIAVRRSEMGRAFPPPDAELVRERHDRPGRRAGLSICVRCSPRHLDGDHVLLDRPGLFGTGLQDRRPFQVTEVVGHVLHGPSVELEGLAPCRQTRRLACAREGRLERLPAETGPFVMDGRVDLRRALQPGSELACSRVVAAALRGGDRPVQRIAQQLVAEVVQPADAGRVQDELVDQLLERSLDRVRRQVHDPGEHVRHEAPADDRPGARGRLRFRRQLGDAGDDGILDGLGHVGLADRGAVGPRIGAERAEQLLDVQRDAVRPLVDRECDVARRGQAGVEQQRRDQGRLGEVEPVEVDLLGDPLGDLARAPGAEVRAPRHFLAPVVARDQQRRVARPAGELGDDLEADVIRPVQVLERQHRRRRDRRQDEVDRSRHEASTADVLGARGRVVEREQLLAEGSRTPACGSSCGPGRGSTPPGRRGPGARPSPAPSTNPRASAFRVIAPRNRVLPMPACPASSRNWP